MFFCFVGGGSGLGLFITRAIVTKHGGTVGFDSEGLGHGCNFYFTLPAFHDIANKTEGNIVPSASVSTDEMCIQSAVDNRTLLICDDSNLIRKMLKKILLRMGCKDCIEACNGLEAVNIVKAAQEKSRMSDESVFPFDLILMDYHMPVMNGPDATRIIREVGYKDLIIGVTGNLAAECVDKFRSCGADTVLSKPLDMSNLERFLQRCGY